MGMVKCVSLSGFITAFSLLWRLSKSVEANSFTIQYVFPHLGFYNSDGHLTSFVALSDRLVFLATWHHLQLSEQNHLEFLFLKWGLLVSASNHEQPIADRLRQSFYEGLLQLVIVLEIWSPQVLLRNK